MLVRVRDVSIDGGRTFRWRGARDAVLCDTGYLSRVLQGAPFTEQVYRPKGECVRLSDVAPGTVVSIWDERREQGLMGWWCFEALGHVEARRG